MGGAMKSMLAKQGPQRSPWVPMRVRQAMQTGGKRRSARRVSTGRMTPALAGRVTGAGGASRLSSASPVGMEAMIELGRLKLKVRSARVP
jgi:hypothetical protein